MCQRRGTHLPRKRAIKKRTRFWVKIYKSIKRGREGGRGRERERENERENERKREKEKEKRRGM